MWNMEKVILVTNNDRVYEKYREDMEVLLLDSEPVERMKEV